MKKTTSSSIEKREDTEKIEEETTVVECIIITPTTTTRRPPWEELPHHLLELFLKPISEPLDRPNLSRVCKAWQDFKPPPRSYFPALVYGPTITKFIKGVVYGPTLSKFMKGVDECVNRVCCGSSQGWSIIRITKDEYSNYSEYLFYLLNIDTKDTILLPIFPNFTLMPQILLSTPPTDPDCIALVFDVTLEGFMFTKRGWNKWIQSDCKYPFFSRSAEQDYFYHVFLFQRKFYACTHGGYIVAIHIDVSTALLDEKSRIAAAAPPTSISLTVLRVDRIVPRIDPTLGIQSCNDLFPVESLGKLLVVRLYRPENYQEIINIDVLELDFKTMSWMKVENLPGDQVLFLSLCSSFSISGSEIGIGSSGGGGGGGGQGNCIYVSDHSMGKIHKYDMHNQEMMVCTGYGYLPKAGGYRCPDYMRLWVKPTFV